MLKGVDIEFVKLVPTSRVEVGALSRLFLVNSQAFAIVHVDLLVFGDAGSRVHILSEGRLGVYFHIDSSDVE